MEDLKELIIQTLDAAGVLDKIRAQLRLQVFKAVQNDEGKLQNENSKPVKIAQNPEGCLAAALFRDFLECYKMKYSLNVLIPEFHLPQDQDVRSYLSKELKFTPEAGEPFLSYMLNFLIKSPAGTSSDKTQAKEEEKYSFEVKNKREEPKPIVKNLPEIKTSTSDEPKALEKKALPKIPEFKKPVEEAKVEKKPLANIPEFKGAKPKEEEKPKGLGLIPEFKGKEDPKPDIKPKQVEEPKKVTDIPEFKSKPREEDTKKFEEKPKAKPVDEPKVPEKKNLANIPEFKGKPEEKLPEKKPLASIPDFKGKPAEEKNPEKKPATNIPEFKGKPAEVNPVPEKKTLAKIPEFKGKPVEEPKPADKKSQQPDNKGMKKDEIPSAKPLAIPEFKGKKEDPPAKSLKHQELPKGREEDRSKNVQVQGKSKVPQILLPDIDSPRSSDRFEESQEKDAIDDVKKRLQNYGNYIEEVNEDISSKKFEFDNYGDSDEYEEESGEYYAELSDDPSMHSEYLNDYDLIEDAEIVQSEEEEEEEGSSNS